MTTADSELGHYASRHRRAFFLAWSHGSRFRKARQLVTPFVGRRLLDYGCGDGTFLGQVSDLFPNALGADIAAEQVEDCKRRFASHPGLRFVTTGELATTAYAATFDVVTCMEVLEHCTAPTVEIVLDDLFRLTSPGGKVIISVPVEIGPFLIAKQALRRVAGWMGIHEYKLGERYRLRDLTTMLFAGPKTRIDRPVYGTADGTSGYHGHMGFNWKALRERIAERFTLDRTAFTPLNVLDGAMASQAWLIGRKPGGRSEPPAFD